MKANLDTIFSNCSTSDLISPFPKSTEEAMKSNTCKEKRNYVFRLLCTCRTPWRKAKNNIYAKQMVECSESGESFTECVKE